MLNAMGHIYRYGYSLDVHVFSFLLVCYQQCTRG